MSGEFIRKSNLLGCVLLLSCLITGLAAQYAAPPGGHLNISEVFVDFDNDGLVISGTDFSFGRGPTVVTLGEFGALTINSETDTKIVAVLPGVPDGDYLLTVSRGTGQSQNDEFDLTIGAVGPKGDKGNDGPQGPPGTDGTNGTNGTNGADGATGPQGDQGPPGTDGTNGTNGATGPQGPVGPQGDTGPAGADGGATVRNIKVGPFVTAAPNALTTFTLACTGVDRVVSGGYTFFFGAFSGFQVLDSYVISANTWQVRVFNGSSGQVTLQLVNLCETP